MKRWIRFGAIATMVTAMAVPAFANDVRVGDFYMQIAKYRNIAATDGTTAERGLRAQGIALPSLDLRKALTEGDVARISQSLGVRVTTQRPEAPVTEKQVNGFLNTFGSDFGGIKNPGPQIPMDPPHSDPQPDKGQSKGFFKSPTEPV